MNSTQNLQKMFYTHNLTKQIVCINLPSKALGTIKWLLQNIIFGGIKTNYFHPGSYTIVQT